MKNEKVVCRLGPSPTSPFGLHLGNIRTLLYNYLFVKKHGGELIVRIEDTDQERFQPGAEDLIKKTFDYLGIVPDQSPWLGGKHAPYRQSERDYSNRIKYLLDNGYAYYAFDTKEDIDKARKEIPNFSYGSSTRMNMRNSLSLSKSEVENLKSGPHVIRFKVNPNRTIVVDDIINGKVSFNSNQIDDKVLLKTNGMGSYHLCNVSDDHDMEVTHVIRGNEWLPSLPFHILLYEAFGWTPPKFAHLPLILNPKGGNGKLSKRHSLQLGFPIFPFGGETIGEDGNKLKIMGFSDEGYDPDSLLNFLLLLGWSPEDGKEIMNIDEMSSKFDLKKVHKSGAIFDIEKARFFNQYYLQNNRSDEELLKHIDMGSQFIYSDENLAKIVDICKKRSTFTKDLQAVADIFFKPVIIKDSDRKTITDDYKNVMNSFISKDINWTAEAIKQAIFDICAEKSIKMGKVMPALRVAIAGGLPGPDLVSTMSILSKEEVIKRIKNSLDI